MSPTFDFLVKIDKIYVTSHYFREMLGTLPTKFDRLLSFMSRKSMVSYSVIASWDGGEDCSFPRSWSL